MQKCSQCCHGEHLRVGGFLGSSKRTISSDGTKAKVKCPWRTRGTPGTFVAVYAGDVFLPQRAQYPKDTGLRPKDDRRSWCVLHPSAGRGGLGPTPRRPTAEEAVETAARVVQKAATAAGASQVPGEAARSSGLELIWRSSPRWGKKKNVLKLVPPLWTP